jgi:hypothetical protein
VGGDQRFRRRPLRHRRPAARRLGCFKPPCALFKPPACRARRCLWGGPRSRWRGEGPQAPPPPLPPTPKAPPDAPRATALPAPTPSVASAGGLLLLLEAEAAGFGARETSQALHVLAALHRHGAPTSAPAAPDGGAEASSSGGGAAPPPEAGAWDAAASERAAALLCDLVVRNADEFDAWGVALGFWSLGALGCASEPALRALCGRGLAVLRGFGPADCAQALTGWAHLRVRTREQRGFVDALLSQTLDALSGAAAGEWRAREVAAAAWALARVGAGGAARRALLETLMDVAQWRLDDFSIQVRARCDAERSGAARGGGARGGARGGAAAALPWRLASRLRQRRCCRRPGGPPDRPPSRQMCGRHRRRPPPSPHAPPPLGAPPLLPPRS